MRWILILLGIVKNTSEEPVNRELWTKKPIQKYNIQSESDTLQSSEMYLLPLN
jgi:hypothetical protein